MKHLFIDDYEIHQRVQWREHGDLAPLLGRTVRIRFSLLRAQLYAFWFTPNGGNP